MINAKPGIDYSDSQSQEIKGGGPSGSPCFMPNIPAVLALPAPPLITLFQESGILRKLSDWECLHVGPSCRLRPNFRASPYSVPQPRRLSPEFTRKSGGLPPNAPGFEPPRCGTKCGNGPGSWHAGPVKRPRLAKKGIQKSHYLQLKGGF